MELKLSDTDLRWANWRNIPPEPKPKSKSFDLAKSLEKIRKLNLKQRVYNISKIKVDLGISKEEARFWVEAFSKASMGNTSGDQLIDYLDRPISDYTGVLSRQDVRSIFSNSHNWLIGSNVLVPLYILLSPSDFIDITHELAYHIHYHNTPVEAFRLHILPYMTESERDLYRVVIRPHLTNVASSLIPFAAMLGKMDTELESYLNSIQQNQVSYQQYDRACYAALGLSDPEKVRYYITQKKINLYRREYILAWIAHTELTGLDWVAQSIKNRGNKTERKSAFKIFKKICVAEAVPHVLALWEDEHLVSEVLDWLVKNPEIVVESLTPLALRDDKQSKLAMKYLRRMVSMGQTAALEAMLPNLDAADQERFQKEILEFYVSDVPEFDESNTPEWLSEACEKQGKSKRTSVQWVDLLSLPPLTIDSIRLNQDQIQHLLIALRGNNEELIDGIREHTSQAERDEFMWAVYQCWEDAGTPSKGKWAFDSLGKLGGDTIVMKLMPLLKKWPGESKHKRASDGIIVLQEIGTDTALMQINSLAQKIRYKSLKKKAREAMEHIAKARGMTQVELEDRIIPDCGLAEDGTRIFDFGPRQFTFVLSSDMKPMIRDEKGKTRTNLPKPNKKDDEGLAAQATADWKLIKKQVREVAKLQAERLEQAMISQRRWSFKDFSEFYVKHPLMFHIVRLLLWGGYDETGELIQVFRVDEDRQIVDVDDEPLNVDQVQQVGVLHVMELGDSDRQEWGDVLSDYELIAPFQQLSRKVSSLEDDEVDQKIITRFEPFKVEPVIMVSILEKSGWVRGQAQDAGMYYSHARYYAFADVTALVRYHGVPMGYWDFDKQGIDQCFFMQGDQRPEGYAEYKEEQMLTLGEVSPVVMSETLRTLYAISSKAE